MWFEVTVSLSDKVKFRTSEASDALPLKKWLLEPGILEGFPMINEREIDDAIRIWLSYIKIGATLTAEIDGKPCGMANLYIQPFKKLSHQCLFVIVVDKDHRGQGIGTKLLSELSKLARETFHVEILHLEVYESNPAYRMYERLGFKEYGRHENFLKENGKYSTKIFMQKDL